MTLCLEQEYCLRKVEPVSHYGHTGEEKGYLCHHVCELAQQVCAPKHVPGEKAENRPIYVLEGLVADENCALARSDRSVIPLYRQVTTSRLMVGASSQHQESQERVAVANCKVKLKELWWLGLEPP